eukprot:9228603-Alexandrium_andersonii.AAC.1
MCRPGGSALVDVAERGARREILTVAKAYYIDVRLREGLRGVRAQDEGQGPPLGPPQAPGVRKEG